MTATPTVVLVDDAADLRELVRIRLRLSKQFDVVGEGSDGFEAISLASQHEPNLMLLDVSMPRLGGLEALPRVLAASPKTKVVLYSGFSEEGLAARGVELGATAFIEKSVAIDRLADELAEVLGRPTGAAEPAAASELDAAAEVITDHLERFRQVFDEAAIGMATITLTGQVVRANAALGALFDRDHTGLVGVAYPDLADPEDDGLLRAAIAELGANDRTIANVEHGTTTADGPRRIEATLAVVQGRHGQPLYLFLQAQDVTEARQAVRALRMSEERFRLLVETVRDYAIFMLDTEGHIASWNRGAERIKGYTADEIIGKHFRTFYPAAEQERGHPEHELVLALRDGRYEEEGWRVRKDGSQFWASVVITAVHDPDGRHIGFAKVTRDVTERRMAAEEREAMNVRLARAAEEQAQFLAVTAHELRGPVGVLGGSADMLMRHWSELEPDERDDLLAGMRSSAERLQRLLADLLTAARVEAGAIELRLEEVGVAGVVTDAITTIRRSAPDLETDVDVPAGLVVTGDRGRVQQMLENLIGNAMRYGARPVRINAIAAGDRVEVRVSDSGPGVPDSVAPQLFERFATGQRQSGTGLGLFIVRELARAQRGDAWYEPPEADRPHAFVLSLPTKGR
ncbi:MAG TPA: PAS domain S-box protein [Mycobacteriales bacterium]|nr:PAS domain S-box protein [Mycobacteriales bacterium]